MTLADHAKAWWTEQGRIVPPRDSPEFTVMYAAWIEYAFEGIGESDNDSDRPEDRP